MENKPLSFVLIVFVGILAGISALFSINAVIQSSMQPYMSRLAEISQSQRAILKAIEENKQTVLPDVSSLMAQLSTLEMKVRTLESRPTQAAPQPARPQPPQEDFNKVYEIPIDGSHVYGNEDAPITIVGFKDFECPFCARFHAPVVQAVDQSNGKARYIIKNYPLPMHRNAVSAAKAALAAGEQGKYFEMADKLLENYRNLGEDKYADFAKEVGLNVKKFQEDLKKNDAQYQEIINKDMALGGKVSVRGTPTYFINGKKTQARTLQQYQQEIQALLAQ